MVVLRYPFQVAVLAAAVGLAPIRAGSPVAPAPVRVNQPVQEYFTPFGVDTTPADRGTYGTQFTHLGTDFGAMGPEGGRIGWAEGGAARVDLTKAEGWAGLWHSLAGAGADRGVTLDFARCYPAWIKDEYQPRCNGVYVRASGTGRLGVEIKGADERVLWARTIDLDGRPKETRLDCDPAGLRAAKFLNWVAEPGTVLAVDAIGLMIQYPPLALADRTFLIAYAKLARCAAPGTGLVKDQSHRPVGAFDAIPASGLYALATAVAADRGVVDRTTALAVLAAARRAFAALPKADGWLPHFVTRGPDGKYGLAPGTEYGTVDTSIAYHGLLLAAHLLGDRGAEADVLAQIRKVRFDRVRGSDGFVRYGLAGDGKTPLAGGWVEWGGEAALIALLERMAAGPTGDPKMSWSGKVPDGVGFVAELQSLFYPQFDGPRPDAVTGVDWLAVRRELARAQAAAVAQDPQAGPAARLGLFGQSAGEGFRGRGYLAEGLRARPAVLHPHYTLMAGLSAEDPGPTWKRVRALEGAGLMPPWGLVENFTSDLAEYLPVQGSLNAALECLAAYHLAARTAGRPDRIYEAARSCEATSRAAELFYPDQFDGARPIDGTPGTGPALGDRTSPRFATGGLREPDRVVVVPARHLEFQAGRLET
jgi:hypothetical protein